MIGWSSPRFAEPLQLIRGQGDPLDLASTNERLYNTVFPGFNNTVRYIGVYSALCWMAMQVQRHLHSAQGLTNSAAEALQLQAMEKMELALLWASGLEAELSGKTRQFPGDGTAQRLTMDQWAMDARLMSAPQYLPSLTSGLKFLNDEWICTDRGAALGNAFGDKLGPPQSHRWLRDPACVQATAAQIGRASAALSVLERPSAEERSAFLASFFPADPRSMGAIADPRDRQRWETLHLVLHALAQLSVGSGAQNEQAIRAAMTSGLTRSSLGVVRPGLERCHAIWAVLQVRILQRMALETLLGFVISWVRVHSRTNRSPTDCAREIGALLSDSFAQVGLSKVSDLRARIAKSQRGHATLSLAATVTGKDAPSVFFYLTQLRELGAVPGPEGNGAWLRLTLTALAVCAVETGNFLEAGHEHANALNSISAERTSLTSLHASFVRLQDKPLTDWARELLLNWVFSRYDEVATQRAVARNGKLRFDFIQGEYGLESGPPRNGAFRAVWQTDKLYTALVLLQQCGLIIGSEAGWRLTAAGRHRVRDYQELPARRK